MELKKAYIHMNYEKGRALSQITLDDDYNLPDYKPDIVKVMKDKGEVSFDEAKISDGHLHVKGALQFVILYRSDQDEKKIDCLSGTIPFTETISMDGIDELDPVHMTAEMEDLSIGIINSRKLNIRALVMLKADVREMKDEEMVTDVEAEEPLEVQKEYQEVLQLVECKKDNFRLKQEISLPSSKPNIRDIIWKSVQLRGLESKLKSGGIDLMGEVLVYILYFGEEDTGRLQWVEATVPLSGNIACNNCEENLIFKVNVTPRSLELEAKPDYDGEQRMMTLDMVLDLDICLWKEESMEIVKDLYSLAAQITPEFKKGIIPGLVAKNFAKCKVNDRIQLNHDQENILQICVCEGQVHIDNTTTEKDGVKAEGTLEVEIMYITSDDAMPIGTLKGLVAFEQMIEVPGVTKSSEIELEAGIEQLSALLMDNTQVEIKAVINLNLIAFANRPVEKLVSVEVSGENMEELQKQPGIVGYIVKDNENLWAIAKKNHTTIADLVQMNQLVSEEVGRGDKLLIVKTV